jgi:hypothetical protein
MLFDAAPVSFPPSIIPSCKLRRPSSRLPKLAGIAGFPCFLAGVTGLFLGRFLSTPETGFFVATFFVGTFFVATFVVTAGSVVIGDSGLTTIFLGVTGFLAITFFVVGIFFVATFVVGIFVAGTFLITIFSESFIRVFLDSFLAFFAFFF